MGLPRYLKDCTKKIINEYKSNGFEGGRCYQKLGQQVAQHNPAHVEIPKGFDTIESRWHTLAKYELLLSTIYGDKSYYEWKEQPIKCLSDRTDEYFIRVDMPRCNTLQTISSLYRKVKIQFHSYWAKKDGKWTAYYVEIPCNYYYVTKAEKYSEEKMNKEKELIDKKEELDKIRLIEQGRIYKGRLRQMIFERDEYTCKLCGKKITDGVSLEVDHIVEWEDGGKTTYDNGQTLCSDCNKGKHHFKKYKNKIEELQYLTIN